MGFFAGLLSNLNSLDLLPDLFSLKSGNVVWCGNATTDIGVESESVECVFWTCFPSFPGNP